MFILFPAFTASALRPVVTMGLLVINVATFFYTWPYQLRHPTLVSRDAIQSEARKLAALLLTSNSLRPEDRQALETAQTQERLSSPELNAVFQRADPTSLSGTAAYEWSQEWPVYQSLMAAQIRQPDLEEDPLHQWAFRPHQSWWPGLLTHLFVHEGWVHLIGNLLFLWIAGLVLEAFLGFGMIPLYILSGMAGATTQALWGAGTDQILVGASGAISGLLGFALMTRPEIKVTLFYGYWLSAVPRGGTWEVPVWFCVSLWALQQLFLMLMLSTGATQAVGYADHLGGFAFGLLVGIVARLFLPSR